jgi:hypothetical protein
VRVSEKIIRADALTDALRAIQIAIGDAEPHAQIYQAIGAIKTLRAGYEVRVQTAERIDYLDRVQQAARQAWAADGGSRDHDATAAVDTPLGTLTATVWRKETTRGAEWKSSYSLDGKPIGVRDIKLAGLAQRPTSRNRKGKIA